MVTPREREGLWYVKLHGLEWIPEEVESSICYHENDRQRYY